MKRAIGLALVLAPFGAVFGAAAYAGGFIGAVAVFGTAAGGVAIMAAGIYLIVD